MSTLVHQSVLIDPTDTGSVGAKSRRDPFRQLAADPLHVLQHSAARPVDVRAVLEDDVNKRVAEHRLSTHGFHPWCRKQGRNDRVGNLVFDELGATARPLAEDDDLRIGEVRNGVKGNAEHRPYAPRGGEEDEEKNKKAVAGTSSR